MAHPDVRKLTPVPAPAEVPPSPALEAVQALLLQQLALIRAEEEGVRRDQDIEHLHRLRVALRRSRSALSMLREVFPAAVGKRFRKDLRWIGTITGPVRDLDVWLVKLDRYMDQLPATASADLAPLWRHLRAKRVAAHATLIKQLDRKRFRRVLDDWERFLSTPCEGPDRPAAADLPARQVAATHISALFAQVVHDGGAITDATPDATVHDLRILVKKLRYLVGFFGDLFDPEAVAALRKPHKALQSCLGDFNDLCVQAESLRTLALELIAASEGRPETFLAIGHLQGRVAAWQVDERARFASVFAPFAGPESRKAYAHTFS